MGAHPVDYNINDRWLVLGKGHHTSSALITWGLSLPPRRTDEYSPHLQQWWYTNLHYYPNPTRKYTHNTKSIYSDTAISNHYLLVSQVGKGSSDSSTCQSWTNPRASATHTHTTGGSYSFLHTFNVLPHITDHTLPDHWELQLR